MTVRTNDTAVSTRIASLEEVRQLLSWADDEGWNPGLEDEDLFYATDPAGFLVSTLGDQVVAGISLVQHTHEQSFLGLYLCAPEHRAKGIGMATWRAAMDTVDDHTIGLDGVADQQENYRKSGFVYHFGNCRYFGVLDFTYDDMVFIARSKAVQITKAVDADINAIINYDAAVGGFDRSRFFRAWIQSKGSRTMFIARKGGRVVGVIGVRRCLDGNKVGPWLADSQFIAAQLLHAVRAVTKHEIVMIDIPDTNNAAIEIAEALGLEYIFDTARMYKGRAPDIDGHRLFGVATLELG